MPRNLSATPVAFTSITAIPANGEGVDSDSVALYAQKLINEGANAAPVVATFTTGAHQVLTGSSFVETPTGSDFRINDLDCAANADGGGVSCTGANGLTVTAGPLTAVQPALFSSGSTSHGRMRAPKAVAQGSNAAGTHVFLLNATDHVWNGSAAAGGCIWQIFPGTGADVNECIRLVHRGTSTIQVNDHTGSPLITLTNASGGIYAVTFAWNGTGWDLIDVSFHP